MSIHADRRGVVGLKCHPADESHLQRKPGTQSNGGNSYQHWMSNMGVSQPIRDYEMHERWSGQSGPLSEHSPVAVARRFLDAALRIWDEDQAQAKSQIKIAAAMLRGDIDEPPMQETPPGRVAHGLVPWQARKVEEFIGASLGSKIRLQDCASETRLSVSHFSRAFKATFGTTVLDYIHRRRVEQAQQLMLISGQPLSQIALSCGFADQAHYCRIFRAVVGISPNTWRRQNLREAPYDLARSEGDIVSRPPGRPLSDPASTAGRAAPESQPAD